MHPVVSTACSTYTWSGISSVTKEGYLRVFWYSSIPAVYLVPQGVVFHKPAMRTNYERTGDVRGE